MDEGRFVDAVGFAFEHSPWIAREAWLLRPFRSAADLLTAMTSVAGAASEELQIALISAHPDLAGRLAKEGRLTAASANEQRAAGLDRLTPSEIASFQDLNRAYRERFGFPFVVCARENTKASILAALESRLRNDRPREVRTALDEIAKIARLRLTELLGNS